MKIVVIGMLACLAFLRVNAAEPGWMTDLPKAQAKAKAENKMVLMEFTGSDWCPPCKALYKNVLSTSQFQEYAKTNLVLVEVDFPRNKPQTDEQRNTNQSLQKEFGIAGYPTIIVLNSEGKELINSVGYGGDKAEDFVSKLDALKKKP